MSQCGTSVPPVVAFVSFSSAITRALRASLVGCAAAIIDVSASIDRLCRWGPCGPEGPQRRSRCGPDRGRNIDDRHGTADRGRIDVVAGVAAAPNGPDCVASAPMAALEAQLSRIGEQGAIDTAHVVFVYERGSSAGEYYAAMYLDKYEGALGDRLRVLARDDIMLSAKVGRGGGGGGGRRLRNGNREGFAVPKAPIGCYAEDVDPRLAILVTPDVVTSLRGIMVYARELVDHSAPALAGI
jgi:hypothetical protein